jgi:hypothetical protein
MDPDEGAGSVCCDAVGTGLLETCCRCIQMVDRSMRNLKQNPIINHWLFSISDIKSFLVINMNIEQCKDGELHSVCLTNFNNNT